MHGTTADALSIVAIVAECYLIVRINSIFYYVMVRLKLNNWNDVIVILSLCRSYIEKLCVGINTPDDRVSFQEMIFGPKQKVRHRAGLRPNFIS